LVENLFAYFGYGSLVNLETLRTKYHSAHPARLKGWRRHWQSRTQIWSGGGAGEASGFNANPALLSVHRHDDSVIDGMVIVDRLESLPSLDEREACYERVVISPDELEFRQFPEMFAQIPTERVFVYVGIMAGPGTPPLLQSYLDTVLAGFLVAHGREGVERFIASTIGFDREIIADRFAPVYPRHVKPSRHDQEWFDQMLAGAGVRYKPVPAPETGSMTGSAVPGR
jgi:hypothetical protein